MKIKYFNCCFSLYIFFIFLSLIIFFFSTEKLQAKTFNVENIEISEPFEIDFDKNKVIDNGFKEAFEQLTSLIIKSTDQKKIDKIKLNRIKGMIETFTIKEEKFVNEIYYVNLGVSFNKRKIFEFLEEKNIFPAALNYEKFLFVPILIDENKKELLIFSENEFFNQWNISRQNYHLIEYLLPTEDLDDFNLIKKNYGNIEEFNFDGIIEKYNLENSIISLIFKNESQIRILSKIMIKDDISIKNQSFSNINLKNETQIQELISQLKIIYEDYWKNHNQINTSIKLPLSIQVKNVNEDRLSKFENVLSNIDLIYSFDITKLNKDSIYYEIIFNGTPDIFLKLMSNNDFHFNTQNRIWTLK